MVEATRLLSHILLCLVISGNIVIAIVFWAIRIIEYLSFTFNSANNCDNQTNGSENRVNIKEHSYKWVRYFGRLKISIGNNKKYTRCANDRQAEEDVKKNIPALFLLLDWAITALHGCIISKLRKGNNHDSVVPTRYRFPPEYAGREL